MKTRWYAQASYEELFLWSKANFSGLIFLLLKYSKIIKFEWKATILKVGKYLDYIILAVMSFDVTG